MLEFMLLIRFFIILILEIIFVQCVIPNTSTLRVKQVDSKLIQRKRMDMLEICRIFENERLKYQQSKMKIRRKREIAEPMFNDVYNLRKKDFEKVESFVEKMYEDLTENGEPVAYRQRKTTTKAKVEKLNKQLFNHSRRFDFAPAFLTGPDGPKDFLIPPPETVPVPWIKKWKHGIIPYCIDSKTYDAGLSEVIMSAFDYFERATCIRLQRLREKPTDQQSMEKVEWVYISNPMGIRQCVHSNERIPNKGVQMVVFGYNCMSTGEIVHEVMHLLGFSHEHTRSDRDQHISIMWDRIKPGYKKYFELRPEDILHRLPYDYASVLHYPPRAFSKNGQITVSAKAGIKLGQREGLSETDVEKVTFIFGSECVDRNKHYLLNTCPSVVRTKKRTKVASQQEIQQYFKDRIWSFGIVIYKLKDEMKFSAEEKENIRSVINHIEKETCIEFRDINGPGDGDDLGDDKEEDGKDKYEEDIVLDKRLNEEDSVNRPAKLVDFNYINIESAEITDNQELLMRYAKNDKNEDGGTVNSVTKGPEEAPTSVRRFKLRKARGNGRRGAKAQRKHADAVLVFTRSTEPGCKCPSPGKSNGDSTIELNADCFNSVNDLLHVFVHILGLDHQHNMHDRDDFLHIVWNKLTPEVKKEMQEKLPPAAAAGFPYDYQSVMHYPWLQIKNGVTSIMYPIWNDGWAMGHWQGLSSTDVLKLSLLYYEQCLERKKHEDTGTRL